ncbi:transcriptional regulator [Flexivirga caeni]|uniref:Transcriptional regulator n=1 Tax=Flexivirga caeni TaxID=2294115 RepID=A0A3M9M516_9MICO|nr:transcriptional regulator [Flexivirga caeni]RNI20654.1 transcriptional regulator [Flexivirga caeni]
MTTRRRPSPEQPAPADHTGPQDAEQVLARLAEDLRRPFDPVLTDPTRLRLQAALQAVPDGGAMSFTALRKVLHLTDGNLNVHLKTLVAAGFVDTEETWTGRRRTTYYHATPAGRAAFDGHVRALRAVIAAAD